MIILLLSQVPAATITLHKKDATVWSQWQIINGSYDAAYDWTPEESWVSHWSWQTDYNPGLSLGNFNADAEIDLPIADIPLDSATNYYLTDLLSGEILSGTPLELNTITTHFDPFQARLFLIADTVSVVNQLTGKKPVLPGNFALNQNYPNPFNPATTIDYQLPATGRIKIDIYDILGQKVMTLFEGKQEAGAQQIVFNGSRLASGVYICRLQFENRSLSRKMIHLK
jgi:hypothetical protein